MKVGEKKRGQMRSGTRGRAEQKEEENREGKGEATEGRVVRRISQKARRTRGQKVMARDRKKEGENRVRETEDEKG